MQDEVTSGVDEFTEWLDGVMNSTGAFYKDIATSLQDESTQIVPQLRGFVGAVNWDEPLIIGLGVFHCFWLLMCIGVMIKGSEIAKFVLFMVIGVFVLIAQPLNSHLADNWQAYATQPYFDANGGFICFMWSTPLIIMEFAILISLLLGNCILLRKTMRVKVQQQNKARKRKADKDKAEGADAPAEGEKQKDPQTKKDD